MNFDYYYGDESNQFAFYRIPRQLITGEAFKKLSTDAKLLYGLLLDRMGLSAKNGWYDDMGRVFIYYTLDEIQEDLNCGHEKAVRLLAELDTGKKGFGLIERVKQGQGRPTKLYVKRFTTRTILPQPAAPQDIPRLPIFGSQDFGKSEVKSSEKQKSRLPVIGSADFRKSDTSYIESNQTDLSQLYPSIHPSATVPESRWIDRSECRREVQEAIEFPLLCQQFGYEDVESVTELIVDTLCSTRPTFRIGGAEMPAEQVKGRLQMLDNGHLEYVFDCMRRNTTEIRNIRAYLLTEGVTENLRKVTQYAAKHEARFMKLLTEQTEDGSKRRNAAKKKELEAAEKRIGELSAIFKRLYEDSVAGRISDERFTELSADYEAEQKELKERAAVLQSELSRTLEATANAEKFMKVVRKYTSFEELTPTLLREFVEKIVIHESEALDGKRRGKLRRQEIEIYYSFVGKVELPDA